MNEKLLSPYNPADTEEKTYQIWEQSGFFRPEGLPGNRLEPFSILMPPLNANGSLHAGHALVMTIEDVMVRYSRMRGKRSLWLPGLDHAGFETQVVYEKELEKRGLSRFEMDPQTLYNEILNFTLKNSENIKSEVKKMGASCDWSRLKFSLDPDIVEIVYKTFKNLEDDNLLYRGKRIISWCPKHQTSFSDLEIDSVERADPLYYLKYGPFTIATARPETKFGDKYVVMHPDDERYKEYKQGQEIEVDWINGHVTATVIKDTSIDMNFGTGVMTITPWHDPVDFEIAQRHNLDKEQIIDEFGKLKLIAGEFAGMKIKDARPKIVLKLEEKGLLARVDKDYKHAVHVCYKCGTPIEPQIQSQWFVKMGPLAEKALKKIESGEIAYIPEYYRKITINWLQNINDWNISRQIVWGIKIPAKICDKCEAGYVDLEDRIEVCPKCDGPVRRDTDTFDTWFSSSQWPFATIGYPDSGDFKIFYPTNVMETAGEIIFFWVSRMIMLSIYRTGQIPFKTVYLHGLVLDAKGEKMSKSRGNVINPLTLTEKFGTDALRMGLVVGNTPGTALSLSEDKIKAYKHFANKIWNIARFVLSNTLDVDYQKKPNLSETDKKHTLELDKVIADITTDLENFRLYMAAEKIYHYVWHEFADVIIEESKKRLQGEEAESARWTLLHILIQATKTLHPFMPFITEEIWSFIPIKEKSLLIVESWPKT